MAKLEKLSGRLVASAGKTKSQKSTGIDEDEDGEEEDIPRVNPSVLAMMSRMVSSGRKDG